MPTRKQPVSLTDITQVMEITALRPAADAFAAIDTLVQKVFDGHRLLTFLAFRPATVEVERLYSSHPDEYPVGGRKQKKGTAFADKVLYRGEFHICHNPDDIKETFFDHELIASLGATGMINIPVLANDTCYGTINASREAGDFSEADFPQCRILAGLTLPLFLAGA